MRITHSKDPIELDIKRFYPPFSVYDDCPGCGKEIMACGDGAYIMYPSVNKIEDLTFYCGACEDAGKPHVEWTKHIVIKVTAEECSSP